MHTRTAKTGFTLMELIVAIAIAAAIMWFVNILFNDTQQAISTGIATGDAIVASETIGDQLEKDAELMMAPDNNPAIPGGFLIIVNKTLGPVDIVDPTQGGRFVTRQESVRTDQLIFMAAAQTGKPFRSLTPKNDDNFINDITANHARIYYGHVTPTQTNGTDRPAASQTPIINSEGYRWLLGRQALLFADNTSVQFTNGVGNDTYASGWTPDSDIENAGGTMAQKLRYGLTDIFDDLYDNPFLSATFSTYPDDYLDATYTEYRLRTNPEPEVTSEFDSWRLAQTHSYLASHVSDFIVEFSADISTTTSSDGVPDGLVDTHAGFAAGNDVNLVPYSAIPTGIKWYVGQSVANYPGGPNDFDSTKPLTFDTPDDATNYPPYVGGTAEPMPAAYALADDAFIFEYTDDEAWASATAATASKWPYMIRVRYRLHDDAGRLRSTGDAAPVSGRWFEHIIKVNRP